MAEFTLEELYQQLQQVKNLGNVADVFGWIPFGDPTPTAVRSRNGDDRCSRR